MKIPIGIPEEKREKYVNIPTSTEGPSEGKSIAQKTEMIFQRTKNEINP